MDAKMLVSKDLYQFHHAVQINKPTLTSDRFIKRSTASEVGFEPLKGAMLDHTFWALRAGIAPSCRLRLGWELNFRMSFTPLCSGGPATQSKNAKQAPDR